MEDYQEFLARKQNITPLVGFDPGDGLNPRLKSFQRDIVRWGLRRGRAAFFEGTGLGKTLQQLEWAHKVQLHTQGRVLIFAPLGVAMQTVSEEAPKWGYSGISYAENQISANTDIVVTNYERLSQFDLSEFSGVVLDECFAAGTPVEVVNKYGNIEHMDIERIRPGDYIVNASGVDRVSDSHKREVPYAVKVFTSRGSFIASPNHPVFTQRGWVGTQYLRPNDHIMETAKAVQLVRDCIFPKTPRERRAKILQSILFSEMADEYAGTQSESSHKRDIRKKGEISIEMAYRNPERKSSCAEMGKVWSHTGSEEEFIHHIEDHEAQTFRAWGEWSPHDRSSKMFEGCHVRELEGGICFVTGKTNSRISNLLQDRLSKSRFENSNRSGWSLPSIQDESGCQEDGKTDFIRVDGIEILELGHHELDKFRDANGKLYFYDLTGTRHPSFSVMGMLVHNSGIIKDSSGKTRIEITDACRDVHYKLCCSATPAPNDYVELGTHSEFLGVMNEKEMLAMYFVHDGAIRANGDTEEWRLKRHAELDFWKWISSWAVVIQNPNDLGYDEPGYNLPPLHLHQVTVNTEKKPADGMLFAVGASTMQERITVRRESVEERCSAAIDIINANGPNDQWAVWCHLNDEADTIKKMIPELVEVRGSDKPEIKSQRLLGFAHGDPRMILTKPKIASRGMNWSNCDKFICIGLNDSFEQLFQLIRRFWRFGQENDVNGWLIASELEGAVVSNLKKKEAKYNKMMASMVEHMRDLSTAEIRGGRQVTCEYNPTQKMELPLFMA